MPFPKEKDKKNEPASSFYPRTISPGDVFIFRRKEAIPCHFLPLGQDGEQGGFGINQFYEQVEKGDPILFLGTALPPNFRNASYETLYNSSWSNEETAAFEAKQGIERIQNYTKMAEQNNRWLITKGLQDELDESIGDPDWGPIDTAVVRNEKKIMGYWLLGEKLIRYDFSITTIKKVENDL